MAKQTITHKYCPACKETKPKTEFYKDKGRSDGIGAQCKSCDDAYHIQWRKTESGKASIKARGQRYRESEAGKEYMRNYSRRWKRNLSPEKRLARNRQHNLSHAYGMSITEYDALLNLQKGVCAICSEPPKNGKVLAVDHDHLTDKVRGLLCTSCNTALGTFRDSVKILESAVAYLLHHKKAA